MSEEFLVVQTPETNEDKLDKFKDVNTRKIPWENRVEVIKKEFPSVVSLNWHKVFREDTGILGHILNDIMKVDLAEPGKPGKRPSIDPKRASERLRQIQGEDFTMMPFAEAFKMLVGDRSIRAVAAKTGLDRNVVHRLFRGGSPTAREMECVAHGFKKDPGFFVEYRLSYLFGILYRKMEVNPEATVGFYRKVKGLSA
jgi:hypothetical protein